MAPRGLSDAEVLVRLLEQVLTEVARAGYTPWHAMINDLANNSGNMRRIIDTELTGMVK